LGDDSVVSRQKELSAVGFQPLASDASRDVRRTPRTPTPPSHLFGVLRTLDCRPSARAPRAPRAPSDFFGALGECGWRSRREDRITAVAARTGSAGFSRSPFGSRLNGRVELSKIGCAHDDVRHDLNLAKGAATFINKVGKKRSAFSGQRSAVSGQRSGGSFHTRNPQATPSAL
jgi:hypothetical protein